MGENLRTFSLHLKSFERILGLKKKRVCACCHWIGVCKVTMFCLIIVGEKFMSAGIGVVHISFIVFPLVDISNFIVLALP
jgi:hypothetical protein